MFRRLETRWQRRWGPVSGRVEAHAATVIKGRTRAEVWAFIKPAESAVLTSPECLRAFTVPGTGPGVGEQQCFVYRHDGREVARLTTLRAVEEEVSPRSRWTTSACR